jgi:hypothetical protein
MTTLATRPVVDLVHCVSCGMLIGFDYGQDINSDNGEIEFMFTVGMDEYGFECPFDYDKDDPFITEFDGFVSYSEF